MYQHKRFTCGRIIEFPRLVLADEKPGTSPGLTGVYIEGIGRMQMIVDQNKLDGDLVPLREAAAAAGCTEAELLRLAANAEISLHVALRPFTASLVSTKSHKNPTEASRRAPAEQVPLMPEYANELWLFGKVTVKQYEADAFGRFPLWGWHYWTLDEPQEATIDHIYIPRDHVACEQIQQPKPNPMLPAESVQDVQVVGVTGCQTVEAQPQQEEKIQQMPERDTKPPVEFGRDVQAVEAAGFITAEEENQQEKQIQQLSETDVKSPLMSVRDVQTDDLGASGQPDNSADEILAELFDPVKVTALEKMFVAEGKWKSWVERAAANGLKESRVVRGQFNPYKAGLWFLNRGIYGWDRARLIRVLANNLPARSIDSKHLLGIEHLD
jgi:hypothetical protein